MSLMGEFLRIKHCHHEAIKKRAARIVLGPSVMRVYAKGTGEALRPLLAGIDADVLIRVTGQEEYSVWFDEHVDRIAQVIDQHNPGNPRIRPGIKWGHATKIMALLVRELVLCSRYFSDCESERISYFLHVPIDSVVIGRLKALGCHPPFAQIKGVDTREKFYWVQHTLEQAARQHGVPRVWFDDNWGDRQ